MLATDTDIMAILLLNHHHFGQKQLILNSSDDREKLDMSKLIQKMQEDKEDTNLTLIRNTGVSISLLFGLIHPLIGSDILCSPRGFGPAWVIKTCIDYGTYLFNTEHGLQLLMEGNSPATHPYVRFILALFKKRFSSKIKRKPEEVLLPTTDYTAMISELQKETWVHTVESKSLLPSQECLILREKNLSFQLQIWGQATKPQMIIPKPEDYGWEKIDNEFELQADSESNIKKQKTNYDIIMMRCACKSSQCRTRACKCKKAGNHCTALCDCINCENGDIPEAQNPENTIPDITDIMEEDEDSASESETEIGEFEVPDEDDADVDY